MKYKVKYRHFLFPFFKTLKVCGHNYNSDADRMDFYLVENRGIVSIPLWSQYILKLGSDFIISQKEDMEDNSGQSIKLKK